MAHHSHRVMVLVAERKLADFISPPTPGGVLEASGVIAKGALKRGRALFELHR